VKKYISFVLNGYREEVEVESWWTLLYFLREVLELTGTKEACGMGECGACTVIVNEKAVVSCIFPVIEVDGGQVWTIEGLSKTFSQDIHPIQEAFMEKGAVQCGFCTPGMIMSAKALLDQNPHPTKDEIKTAIEGNLCRCGGYLHIIKAIETAAKKLSREMFEEPIDQASNKEPDA
jgi:carbon-monoxide dehydrogenase small subunit